MILTTGIAEYSFQSQYNLLPASMVSASLLYADETIPECSAPADAGGFAFAEPRFNKVFANAAGTFVELEMGSDPHYDSTGLQRIHTSLQGHYTLLGPTAGPPWENGAAAVGPFWTMRDGCDPLVPLNDSLANATYADVADTQFLPGAQPNASIVPFTVTYTLLSRLMTVTEEYVVQQGGAVTVTVSATRARPCVDGGKPFNTFGVTFPALIFDGRTNFTLTVDPSSNSAVVGAPGFGSTTFTVESIDSNHPFTWDEDPRGLIASRNGYMRVVRASVVSDTDAPRLTFTVQAAE